METYKVHCACDNCNWDDTIEVEKGTPVSSVDCPSCGRKALVSKDGK